MMIRQNGFSMIEVLVSIVILAIGVVGMAGLQIFSMQQNRSALLQGEATLKANDILDRIRANPSVSYAGIDLEDAPGTTSNCEGTPCSEAVMKDYDIAQWQCSINSVDTGGSTYSICTTLGVSGSMPGGPCVNAGDVCAGGSIALSGGIYTVTVQWADQIRGNAGGANRSISVRMREP